MIAAREVAALRQGPSSRSAYARALFRLGRFDEALAEQRQALKEARADSEEEFRGYLDRLEADIAEWRDENGKLRTEKWLARIAELDREIAEIEADPDVQIWLREENR